jgi:hypothetical protein
MTDKNKNDITGRILEGYYKYISEAHIDNILDELDSKKDEIDKTVISDRMNDWFRKFASDRRETEKRIRRAKQLKRISSRAAAAAAVLLVITISLAFSVEAFKYQVFSFFTKIYDRFTEIRVDDGSDDPSAGIDWKDVYYYPSYLPRGYSYKSCERDGERKTIFFTDVSDTILKLTQAPKDVDIRPDTGDSAVSDIRINDAGGLLIIRNNRVILFWNNDKYSFVLSGYIDSSEMIKVAESLRSGMG